MHRVVATVVFLLLAGAAGSAAAGSGRCPTVNGCEALPPAFSFAFTPQTLAVGDSGVVSLTALITSQDSDPITGFVDAHASLGDFASYVTSFKYGGVSTSLAQELADLDLRATGQTFSFTYMTLEFSGAPSGLFTALSTATLTLRNSIGNTQESASSRFLDVTASTVSPPTSAIPEPATWALMLGGFGLAGSALRRRRAVPATA